jgi:hypothetical protein
MAVLSVDERDYDPVRELFLHTWQRLTPLLQHVQASLPGSQALRYAAFVSAACAAYNGGPRHLARFRDPKTSASLKNIDNAFWQKYRAIQSDGPLAVKQCLAG